MNIDDLTVGQARELSRLFSGSSDSGHPWKIGKCYLIRTVTMTLTGKLTQVTDQELVLKDAAWITDTGRFAQAVASADFSEVEPFPPGRDVIVGRGAVIVAVEIDRCPTQQK